MKKYYVNTNPQKNGDHEVHTEDCAYKPSLLNRKDLGAFPSCSEALLEAKKYYLQSDGCAYCCKECHTR